MILGTLRSRIIEKQSPDTLAEGGFFSLEVSIDEALMQRSGDVKAFAFRTIAAHLSQAVRDTEVPVSYWTFEFEERPVRRYGFPSEILQF